MATAPNPFQQFISGLFGNISGTAPKPTSTPSGSSSYAGPYAPNMTSAATGLPAYGGAPKPAPVSTSGARMFDATAAGDAPFTKYNPGGGPQSTTSNLQKYGGTPNMTDARTGLPAYGGTVSTPTKTPTGGSSSSAAKVSSGGIAPAAFSAPSAPAQAPAAPGAYSSPSTGFAGGGSTPNAQPDYMKSYIDTLSGLYDPNKLEDSQTALDKIRKRAADAQLGERREERRIKENEVGQGLRSFNGQLTENSRKSSAELADLAIAASPFEQYIETARSAAKDIYSVGRDQQTDSRAAAGDALAERKFQEDVRQFGLRYALDQQQENRLGTESTKASKQDNVSAYAQAFTEGNVMADGTPTVDQNGYINPKAFKAAIAEAPANGLSRKEFIEMFGPMLFVDPKTKGIAKDYGLSPVEQKLILGAVE